MIGEGEWRVDSGELIVGRGGESTATAPQLGGNRYHSEGLAT